MGGVIRRAFFQRSNTPLQTNSVQKPGWIKLLVSLFVTAIISFYALIANFIEWLHNNGLVVLLIEHRNEIHPHRQVEYVETEFMGSSR